MDDGYANVVDELFRNELLAIVDAVEHFPAHSGRRLYCGLGPEHKKLKAIVGPA